MVVDLRTQGPQLLGPRPARPGRRPQLRDEPLRLRALHLRRVRSAARRRAGAATAPTSDGCPRRPRPGATDRRLRGQRPSLAPDRDRLRLDRHRAGRSSNDWCQQYPQPLDRRPRLRRRRVPLRQRRRRRELQQRRLGQLRRNRPDPRATRRDFYTPANPCGDPPFPVGTPQTKPTAEGGALRSQSPRRTAGQPRVLDGAILRVDPSTGLAAPGNPLGSSSDVNEQRIIGYGLRNPFRITSSPAPTRSGSPTSAGTPGRRSTGIPDFSTAAQLRLALLRGPAARVHRAQHLSDAGADGGAGLLLQPQRHRRARRRVPDRQLFGGRHGLLPGRQQLPVHLQRRPLLLRLLAPVHVGHVPDGPAAIRTRPRPPPSRRARGGPVDLQIGPDGNLYYVDFNGGNVYKVEYGPVAVASGSPTSGPAPLTVNFSAPARARRRPATRSPTPGTSTATERSTTRRPRTRASSTRPRAPSRRASRSPTITGPRTRRRPVNITAGNDAPTAFIDAPTSSLTWKVNDTIVVLRARHGPAAGVAAGERAVLGRPHPALPVELPQPHLPDVRRRRRRLLPGAGPRVPLVPRDPSHRDRRRRTPAHDERQHPAADREPDVPVEPDGPPAHGGHVHGARALHAADDPRLARRRLGAVAPGQLRLLVVVRRRRPEPQPDRDGPGDLHRDLRGARRRAAALGRSGRRLARSRRQRRVQLGDLHRRGVGLGHRGDLRRVSLRVPADRRGRHDRRARRLGPEHRPVGQGRRHDPRERWRTTRGTP